MPTSSSRCLAISVRQCQTPVLVLPDDTAAHSYAVAIESAMLAPKAEMSLYPVEGTQGADSPGGAPHPFLP